MFVVLDDLFNDLWVVLYLGLVVEIIEDGRVGNLLEVIWAVWRV